MNSLRPHPPVPRRRPRRGAVAILALLCIGLLALILTTALRMTAAEHARHKREAWRAQASWLAESAFSRAAARREADPEYKGETWEIPAAELHGPSGGSVEIAVLDDAAGTQVRLVARYPLDQFHQVRLTRTWPLTSASAAP